MKKYEESKISLGLQNEFRVIQNEKIKQKIESIIKIYEQNIKLVESKNIIRKRLVCQVFYIGKQNFDFFQNRFKKGLIYLLLFIVLQKVNPQNIILLTNYAECLSQSCLKLIGLSCCILYKMRSLRRKSQIKTQPKSTNQKKYFYSSKKPMQSHFNQCNNTLIDFPLAEPSPRGEAYFSQLLRFFDDDENFFSYDQNINFLAKIMRSDDESSLIISPPEITFSEIKQRPNKKKEKNSNAIKKIGRLILSHKEEYKLNGKTNVGFQNMLNLLYQRCSNKSTKCLVDCFNTFHLSALFDVQETVSRFNLRTTRRIFTRLLRKEVMDSYQIKADRKLLYLNTFKCSSLRFMNKRLANRLQNSDNPHL